MFLKIVYNSVKVKDQRIFVPNLVRLYSNLSSVNIKPNLYKITTQSYLNFRKIHCCHSLHKLYIERENNYLFSRINHPLENFNTDCEVIVTDYEQFEALLKQNWRASNATEILKAFKSVKQFCIEKNIPISDTRFDNLVNGLMDHCEKLADDQLLELLYCLTEYPLCESYVSHNFHDVWSCLDDICCWKMHEWDMDKVLQFASVFFKLNLAGVSDYTYEVLDRHTKKAATLNKDQLVNIFFILNVARRKQVDFEYEYALQSKISEMHIDELAVVALGYFKTKSTIHLVPIMEEMVNKVMENSKTIHDIALSAILKILRLSKPIKIPQKICEMLDKLTPEIDRLSDLACLHLALAPTGLLILHKKSLKKCTVKLSKKFDDVTKIRIKEIDRLLNVLTMFNFDPKITPDIFKSAYTELHRPERAFELEKYPRSFVSCLNYLSMKGIFSYELTNRVLDMDFVKKNYGKMASKIPRELFSLDCCIDIECQEYKGKRLPPEIKYKATKWHVEFVPSYDQFKKVTASEKFMLDVMDTVKRIVKDDSFLYVNHVLPHFPRADIILCNDKTTKKFIEPAGFQKYILGDIKAPKSDENLQWYAIMILGWNNTIRDTSIPLGHMVMKERQLKKIGYEPVMVIWNQFMELSSQEKESYILNKLK